MRACSWDNFTFLSCIHACMNAVGTTSHSLDMILVVALKFGFGMIYGRGRLRSRRGIPTCVL